MQFTYDAYNSLLSVLAEKDYAFADYHNYSEYKKCVILRHDVDQNLRFTRELGKIEERNGAKSTWFVLLKTDFYNVNSTESLKYIRELQSMGHEIGLHFDEVTYPEESDTVENIIKEAKMLSDIIETPVTTVSMHRPSKKTLEANYKIPGMINSYGQTFFHDFKYLSDSRRRWREPAEEIIVSEEYKRLHILTHAFWYHQAEETIEQTITNFVNEARKERYYLMKENISDLENILPEGDICCD